MMNYKMALLTLSCYLFFNPAVYAETEFTGSASIDFQFFQQDAASTDQHQSYSSASFEPEIHHSWSESDTSLLVKAFLRQDQHDESKTHSDIRELYWQTYTDNYELRIGISKVFWGATESVHLVDIINQTDNLEGFDGEDKLGQPMVKLSFEKDWGNLDFFVLPYFRERSYAGTESRLRPALLIDESLASFESSDKENNIDIAIRYFTTAGDWDIGFSYFDGTSRDPILTPVVVNLQPVLAPYYPQIQQIGIDLTGTIEDWIVKLEAIQRNADHEDYFAFATGYEYTFYGVNESALDIGIVNEFLYDDRDEKSTTPFQNDILLGLRFNLNNEASTEILTGFIIDVDNHSQIFSAEASQRFGNHIKAELEIRAFSNISPKDISYGFKNDDYLKFSLFYFF